jgi:hypothetical protein
MGLKVPREAVSAAEEISIYGMGIVIKTLRHRTLLVVVLAYSFASQMKDRLRTDGLMIL